MNTQGQSPPFRRNEGPIVPLEHFWPGVNNQGKFKNLPIRPNPGKFFGGIKNGNTPKRNSSPYANNQKGCQNFKRITGTIKVPVIMEPKVNQRERVK